MRLTLLSAATLAAATLAAVMMAATVGFAAPGPADTTHASTPPSAPRGETATGTKLQQFKTETDAKTACGSQVVVWANTATRVLHSTGSKYYGKTAHGAYVCEGMATHAGYHMSKSG